MWAESTDFAFDRERFDAAFAELEEAAYGDRTLAVVLAAVEGLVLESDEVALGDGLALVRAETLRDVPDELRVDEMGTVAMLALDAAAGDDRALEGAGRRLRRLQTALRLWDDAEPSLGPTAWARTDGGAWSAVPLATGVRRDAGDCLLGRRGGGPAARVLRARHPPHAARRRAGLGAAALRARLRARLRRRGADRLAARRPRAARRPGRRRLRGHGRAPRRDLRHARRTARRSSAGSTRRSGSSAPRSPATCARSRRSRTLIADLGGNLRAVLRDVLCGHLDPQLRRVADEMLDAGARRRRAALQATVPSFAEQVPAHEREALDVVDVAVELRDDDRRRVAEPAAQVLDVGGVALGERGRARARRSPPGRARSSPSSAATSPSRAVRARGAGG